MKLFAPSANIAMILLIGAVAATHTATTGDDHPWSKCTRSCGPGAHFRRIDNAAADGETLFEAQPCNLGPCEFLADENELATEVLPATTVTASFVASLGLASDWASKPSDTSWGDCSTTCGEGVQFRRVTRVSYARLAYGLQFESRLCSLAPCQNSNHGASKLHILDDLLTLDGVANDHPTFNSGAVLSSPKDCMLSAFTPWTACSAKCGRNGKQRRERRILSLQTYGGEACPPTMEWRKCAAAPPCPVHCATTQWGARECSKTCGGGVLQRLRTIRTLSAFGGASCAHLREWASGTLCNTQPCPHDCAMGAWGAWGACKLRKDVQATGFHWLRSRRRNRLHFARFGGLACPPIEEHKDGGMACPRPVHPRRVRDCVVGAWKSWSACVYDPVWTGGDSDNTWWRSRARPVLHQESWGGEACPSVAERQECSQPHLAGPRDCTVTQWGAWSGCEIRNGWLAWSWQTRTRAVLLRMRWGGEACPATEEHRWCRATAAQSINSLAASLRGKKFAHAPRLGARDCRVMPWGSWSTCSGARRTRARAIVLHPAWGGESCPALFERGDCTVKSRDCTVTPWSRWTPCARDKSAELYVRTRTRVVLFMENYGGESCPPVLQQAECITGDRGDDNSTKDDKRGTGVPAGCVRTFKPSWWPRQCDGSCKQIQRRFVIFKPSAQTSGARCVSRTESRHCAPCAADLAAASEAAEASTPLGTTAVGCKVGRFGPWDACSRSCNTGVQLRRREVTSVQTFGGVACPWLYEARACAMHKCPVDCAMTAFGQWGNFLHDRDAAAVKPTPFFQTKCSRSCGGGVRVRVREVLRQPAFGGAPCPRASDVEVCNGQPCPDDCIVGRWHLKKVVMWPAVAAYDNSELVRYVRAVKRPLVRFGGAACSPLVYSQYLNLADSISDSSAELVDTLARSGLKAGTAAVVAPTPAPVVAPVVAMAV